jgi:hypothetical protein
MSTFSLQLQLANSINAIYKDAIVKKIDKDNFLDIYMPSINISKGTHLFFNTAKGQIKIGFYVRDIDFINKVMSKSSKKLETYSQGLRLKGNPSFETVEQALVATKNLLQFMDLTVPIPKKIAKESVPKKKPIAKPTKVNPKKVPQSTATKEPITESPLTISPPQNSTNSNCFTRLLVLVGKYIFRK